MQISVSIAGSVEKFADLMNKKAEDLELENTHFITPHGLDEDEHYTTAYELAVITDYALNIDKIAEVVKTKEYTVKINGHSKVIYNTNELLGVLVGVNGVKTGFTNKAGRCLVTSIERDELKVITVVLGADTKKIRTKDSIKLIEYIYANYELVNLQDIINNQFTIWSNINKNRIKVNKAKSNTIKIDLEEPKYKKYIINKENVNNIEIYIENENMYYEAPVYKGTELGELSVKIGNEDLMKLKIYIDNKIERKNWEDYFKECINTII